MPAANILYATFDHPVLKLAGVEALLEAASWPWAAAFAVRYGFRDKPVRLRPLDEDLPLARIRAAITLDAPSLAHLDPGARQVITTENEVNLLTLPKVPGAIALFGAGYGSPR